MMVKERHSSDTEPEPAVVTQCGTDTRRAEILQTQRSWMHGTVVCPGEMASIKSLETPLTVFIWSQQ